MQKALILVADGFQDEEFCYPYYRLLEAGYSVQVYPGGTGKYGMKAIQSATSINLMMKSWDLPWDCVIVPGGWQSPEIIRQMPECLSVLKAMDHLGRCVAAICHGPWVLASAGILKGRRATCYKGMKDDLINAGAHYELTPVVIDKNLVTSPHYRDNGSFMASVLDVTARQHKDYKETHAI